VGPRTLVAPALRTIPRVGWRTGVASALAVVISRPSLWLLGALGFTLRGGLVFLLSAMVVLPTPVELRILLGSNLGSAGLAPSFVALLGVAAVLAVFLLLCVAAILAYLEFAAFQRLVTSSETDEQRAGRMAVVPNGPARHWLVGGIFAVQLMAVGALAVAAIPLVGAIIDVTYQEIIRPSLGGTIYTRVLGGVREPLFILVAAVVVVEMMSALATRRLLLRGFGLASAPPARGVAMLRAVAHAILAALLRPLRRPVGTLATLLLAWLTSVVALAPLGWGIAAAWQSVRGTYLGVASFSDASAMVGVGLVTLALVAMWIMALLVGGFVSALRAALWSADSLR
jgi:hypothetical protein